jgi:hypothetical protein
MDAKTRESEWVAQCSYRLHEHWRTVDLRSLEELAYELWRDQALRSKAPREAAVDWLRRGIPTL